MPKPGLPLFLPPNRRIPAFILIVFLWTAAAHARTPNLSKYPLRVHVLAAGEAQREDRMSPAGSVACDAIDDMISSSSDNSDGTISGIGISGIFGDPCSFNTGPLAGRLLYVQSEESYWGEGRGDLVSPPGGTLGISFQYKDCVRVRVQPGFHSLPARWKKPGQMLEVLIPSDGIPVAGRPLPPVKCSFTVTQHDFVYLLIPPGRLIQVSQEVYWAKPALRLYLSGGTQSMQRRPAQEVAVAAHTAP
ncbi:MAG TPA: hypothetical protein VMQ60_08705 [Acidobacteriaceae bacterium]|nr:hypothetical protein [Acidobacteriaceae bacterium]